MKTTTERTVLKQLEKLLSIDYPNRIERARIEQLLYSLEYIRKSKGPEFPLSEKAYQQYLNS